MKKTGVFIVLALLIAALFVLPASAQTKGRAELRFEAEKLTRGDLFATELVCSRNPGVSSLLVTLRFDPSVLEVYSVEDTALLPGFTTSTSQATGEAILRWKSDATQGDLDATGHLAKIVFRIKDDAVLGETKIETLIQERFFDAQDAKGDAVVFETEGITLTLECLHVRLLAETLTEPTFELAGSDQITCLDCNESWEEETWPTLTSSDGKTVGKVPPGQYSETDEKGLRCDYLYGGAQYELAQTLFGNTIIRAFQISFTKNDSIFVPQGKARIKLTAEFDLPEQFVLYLLSDGAANKVDAAASGGVLEFEHAAGVFVLVSKEAQTPVPSVTTAPSSTTSPASVSPSVSSAIQQSPTWKKEALILGGGVAALILFGIGAAMALRSRKKF